jgi:Na+-driven multidrug efflux pump
LAEPEKIKLNTILWGLIIPLIIGIVIVIFPAVIRPLLDNAFPPPSATSAGSPYAFLTVIFTHGIALMVVLGVPVFIGLTWNQWPAVLWVS